MLILGLKRLISSYLYCVQGGFSSYVASHVDVLRSNPGGGTPIHYLYGYVPPKGVVILKLLV